MGLPVMTAAVVVVAIGPIAVALAMRPGDRSSLALIILGAGAVVLGFLVGLSARAEALVVPSAQRLHAPGVVVAAIAGLLLIGSGVADAISSRSFGK
jgi:hypothetical protein